MFGVLRVKHMLSQHQLNNFFKLLITKLNLGLKDESSKNEKPFLQFDTLLKHTSGKQMLAIFVCLFVFFFFFFFFVGQFVILYKLTLKIHIKQTEIQLDFEETKGPISSVTSYFTLTLWDSGFLMFGVLCFLISF